MTLAEMKTLSVGEEILARCDTMPGRRWALLSGVVVGVADDRVTVRIDSTGCEITRKYWCVQRKGKK